MLLVAERRGVLGEHLLAPRPRRVGVREVVGPHQVVPVHVVGVLERGPVVLERHVDVLGEVLARQLRELLARGQPVAVALVRVVHPVHEVRHPAGVGLDAHDRQVRVALEHAAEHEHRHDVLAAAHDATGTPFIFGPRVLLGPHREDVERERQLELDRRLPELVVDRSSRSPRPPGSPGIITPRRPSALIAWRSAMPSSGVRIAVCPRPSRRSGCAEQYSAIQRLYASKHACL